MTTRRDFLTQVGRAGGFGATYLIMQSLGLLPIASSEASRVRLPGRSCLLYTSILIADDYEVVRYGVRSLVQDHEGWEVCGEAVDGRDTVIKAEQLRPDVVILDIGMPNLNAVSYTHL